MSVGPSALAERIAARLAVPIDPAVAEFARALGDAVGARAVLFYGSNLRTGSLEGVLDFYILLPGTNESAIWPTVSYHERDHHGVTLRAKVATMRLATFARAAHGDLTDTTIWARFVQPSALIWAVDDTARGEVIAAIASAATTAARLAAALGPASGTAEDYWRALFRATYSAEFRVEKSGRENDILSVNAEHFAGLLPLALEAGGIPPGQNGADPHTAASCRRARAHPALVETPPPDGQAAQSAAAGQGQHHLRRRGALCCVEDRTAHGHARRRHAVPRTLSLTGRAASAARPAPPPSPAAGRITSLTYTAWKSPYG